MFYFLSMDVSHTCNILDRKVLDWYLLKKCLYTKLTHFLYRQSWLFRLCLLQRLMWNLKVLFTSTDLLRICICTLSTLTCPDTIGPQVKAQSVFTCISVQLLQLHFISVPSLVPMMNNRHINVKYLWEYVFDDSALGIWNDPWPFPSIQLHNMFTILMSTLSSTVTTSVHSQHSAAYLTNTNLLLLSS